MPTVWFSFRRSMNCGSDPSDVHSPRNTKQLSSILTKKTPATRSGCSRSISNLRDVMTTMHGSKRHISIVNENPSANYSPSSIGSSEFHNPSPHDLMLSDSKFDQLKTETVNVMKSGRVLAERECLGHGDKQRASRVDEVSDEAFGDGNVCHRCRERFAKFEDLESHHLQMHAVSELVEGDSSRKIVEIICRSSNQPHNSTNRVKIDKILKIHNRRRTLARFEDHRETVKTKASKLPKKHPRCIADGNELLRFHSTNLACSLGVNGSFNLCVSDKCGVCRIMRHGFSGKQEILGEIGVFTASTSERALESLLHNDDGTLMMTRKALLVCRVIAGRVHRPVMENARSVSEFMGFDSLAGKISVCSNIEELYLFDSAALLPCFLIICKN